MVPCSPIPLQSPLHVLVTRVHGHTCTLWRYRLCVLLQMATAIERNKIGATIFVE